MIGRAAPHRAWALGLAALAGAHCSNTYVLGTLPGSADAGGDGIDGGGDDAQSFPGPPAAFPSAPVLDGNAPPGSATLFGDPSQGAAAGGPCLVEPEGDALYPQNWLRPRFRWVAAGGENLFELRLHVDNQPNDLVVYTTSASWTMPKAMWDVLRTASADRAMSVSVRGGSLSGGALAGEAHGTQTTMGIAPVPVTGAIVYWATDNTATGSSTLKGFSPGDEAVGPVLTPGQFGQAQQTTSQCIGCHTSTPDGAFAAFTTIRVLSQQQFSDALGLIDPTAGPVGAAPPYVGAGASAALARWNQSALAFTPAHWSAGDRRAVVSYDNGASPSNIVLSWLDLESTDPSKASGTIARSGDGQLAGAPSWSHDGNTIVYVSTNRVCTGRLGNCTPQYQAPQDVGSRADLYVVPYAGGAGGNAAPVQGAADPSLQEYYPSFSPDDQWILFNRIPNDYNLYSQAAAEVFVVPAAGGTPTRLAANDPPQCSGKASPGIANSWGKWGPTALQANGSTYYWVVFSSKRIDAVVPQLYMASIVRGADGTLRTHGAVYLWNQSPAEANHTPAWDAFKIPPLK
jgi:hypothetical protein